ncbi:hypothetical protein H1C71_019830 [Ictidomys tridecemlineatus]|nr:hypothetical protein H1C71_019830 [Ictidomys tridecemlineatus]
MWLRTSPWMSGLCWIFPKEALQRSDFGNLQEPGLSRSQVLRRLSECKEGSGYEEILSQTPDCIENSVALSRVKPIESYECGEVLIGDSSQNVLLRSHAGHKPYEYQEHGEKQYRFQKHGKAISYHQKHGTSHIVEHKQHGRILTHFSSLRIREKIQNEEKEYASMQCGKSFTDHSSPSHHEGIRGGRKCYGLQAMWERLQLFQEL